VTALLYRRDRLPSDETADTGLSWLIATSWPPAALAGSRKEGDDRRRLISSIEAFIRMYRPHAACEDTDLFPRGVVSAHEYDAMAEDFEKKEHELFGEDGFEKTVQRVADLERAIGTNDLARFTPTDYKWSCTFETA
jgi:hypothetical protein